MAAATTPSGPTPHARSRSGRERSRSASASPTNSSFAGPSLGLRPSTQASAAAWQATWTAASRDMADLQIGLPRPCLAASSEGPALPGPGGGRYNDPRLSSFPDWLIPTTVVPEQMACNLKHPNRQRHPWTGATC